MNKIKSKLYNHTFKIFKSVVNSLRFKKPVVKKHAFVVGCQRSGTSMLLRVFDRDLRTSVYREIDEIFDHGKSLRLKPKNAVLDITDKLKTPLIVSKPLLDSQYTPKLLQEYPNSYAIWIYRNFSDVAVSNIKQFGKNNGRKDLLPIIEKNTADWRAEFVPESTFSTVNRLYNDNISNYDAGALFWYVRNQLYFDLNLESIDNVILCKYEDLVISPKTTLNYIYTKMNISPPSDFIFKIINKNALGRGNNSELSTNIENTCSNLLNKLDEVYNRQKLS